MTDSPCPYPALCRSPNRSGGSLRAMITGGNRYIGLHLVFELARRGHEVTVVNSHVADLPEGCRRIHADRREPGALAEALRPHRDAFDIVFDNTAYPVPAREPMVERRSEENTSEPQALMHITYAVFCLKKKY